MVAHCHRIITNQVHAAKIRLCVLQIRLRHTGIYIAAGQQQNAAALSGDLFADPVDQRLLRRQTIFTVIITPEVTVVIVGMQDGDFIGFILLICLCG